MTTFYRAKLDLEEVDEEAVDQGRGYRTDRQRTITSITLTDGTPWGVIAQMLEHVGTLHRADIEATPEADR